MRATLLALALFFPLAAAAQEGPPAASAAPAASATPAATAAATPRPSGPPLEIVVGGLFPLSGSAATFGQSSRQGMELALEDANAAGDIIIGGRPVVLRAVYEDTEGQPEKAASACRKLIGQDGARAIVGAVMSRNSLAIAPICQQEGVPMISPASTNLQVTRAGDCIFRACFTDPFQGRVMANYVYRDLGLRRAAVLFDNGNDYNRGLGEVFRDTFVALGGQVVAFEAFTNEAQTVDFRAQLTTIRAANPDFLYLPNYYTADALIMRQARELGLEAPAGGGDGWDSPELANLGGEDVEGCVFSNHFDKNDPRPAVRSFVERYRERYGADPDALASLAYDAATILARGLAAAGSAEGGPLKEAIRGLTVAGVSGTITFDAERNPVKPAVILRIENGRQVYVATVAP